MSDRAVVVALIVSFAALVTAHLTIAVGLLRRAPRWRSPVAFLVAPLAPYWAFAERMRIRGVVWLLSAAVYAVALLLASRAP
jgi:hypothetical protein